MASLRALQLPPIPEPEFLRLRYRSDLRTLAARWQRPVSPTEFRQGYAAMLAAAEEAECWCWLVDLRSRTVPEATEVQWFINEFLPQLPGHLGSSVYLGMLLPPHFELPTNQLLPTSIDSIASLSGSIVRTFSDEGALVQWLTNCQRSRMSS